MLIEYFLLEAVVIMENIIRYPSEPEMEQNPCYLSFHLKYRMVIFIDIVIKIDKKILLFLV